MREYFIQTDNYHRDLVIEVPTGAVEIGEGATMEFDLRNIGYSKIADVINPKVFKHRYNEENKELEFVWKPKEGEYEMWVKGKSIYFREK